MCYGCHYLGLPTQSAVAGAGSLAGLQHSASLFMTFPVRWVVGGWVRNIENKAQLRPAGAGTLPELGNILEIFGQYLINI